ncbi:MAG: amino acid adenylation domain-containing protein [Acidobacteriota bacterium]|nr:amino acid adenylation domain-containing protein [Acidobacteriota bacterium]
MSRDDHPRPPVDAAQRRELLRRLLEQRAQEATEAPAETPSGLASEPSVYPLSVGQQALFFLYRMAPESFAYNVLFAARIRSPLNVPALERCLDRIVQRHPSLRATFGGAPEEPGKAVQRVHRDASVPLERFTVSGDDEALLTELEAYSRRPFDLGTGPVLRWGLFRRDEEDHAFVMVAHHIAVDFWSFGIMLEELHQLYPAAVDGRLEGPKSLKLPAPPTTYRRYVEAQQALLDGPRGEELLSYWTQRLEDPPTLELPTDRPRSATQSFAGDTHRFDLGPELAQRLRGLARDQGATLFATLLAGLMALLYRYTGQRDILVGSPIAGRERRELETVVGYFANMMVLRCRPRGRRSFADLVEEARGTTLSALEHGELPFPLLVERLGIDRDPSRGPLFDVAFAVESTKMDRHGISGLLLGDPAASSNLAGLEWQAVPLSQQEGQFDLTFHLLETDRSVGGLLMYDTGLFDAATAARMAGHLETLLASAVEEPEVPLDRLTLLPAAERSQLLESWNATRMPWPEDLSVMDLLEAEMRQRPDNLAVEEPGRALSFGQLDRLTARLAAVIQEQRRVAGAPAEAPVAVCAPRSVAQIVAVLSVVRAGGAYLPLDPAYPDRRLSYMATDSGATLVLASADQATRFEALDTPVLVLHEVLAAAEADDWGGPQLQPRWVFPQSLAYLIYTSGSTGRPKGVEVSHRGLANLVHWHHQAFGVRPGDRSATTAGPGFDAAVWELWAHITAGAAILIPSEEDRASGGRMLRWLEEQRIDLCFMATPLAEAVLAQPALAEKGPAELPLRTLLTGGATLHRLPDPPPPFAVINHYGPTESAVVSTSSQVAAQPSGRRPPIGRPLPNLRTYVLGPNMSPQPVGVVGELYVGGRSLARGYRRQPARTAERFVPDPFGGEAGERLYRTGDLARYLPDGELEFIGRNDDQVKIRGFRIELGEIEAALLEQPSVKAAAVLVENAETDPRLVGYAAIREEDPAALGERLREALLSRLPEYMVPGQIHVLDHLPLTPNGKVDRRALPKLARRLEAEVTAGSGAQEASGRRSPSGRRRGAASPRELRLRKLIAGVWAEVLKLDEVDPDASFFDLGGHSLLVGEVLDRLDAQLEDLENPLKAVEIFQFPTVRSLARRLLGDGVEASAELEEESAELAAGDSAVAAAPAQSLGAHEPIAIIGMAGRFPGAWSVDELWRNLCGGEEAVSFFTDEELEASGVSVEERRRKDYVAAAAVLDGVEDFDAGFFGFTPREAEILDPQQRLFLEVAWHTLEDGGCEPGSYGGRIGVFAGLTQSTYLTRHLATQPKLMAALGDYQVTLSNDKDFLPTRVSYKLDLKGPSVNVQTACSTSLVAVHMACRSLRDGECDMALAGGATVRLPLRAGYRYQAGMILSPDGHCRPFDADGHGTVGGNGVAAVLLKPLSRALADGDPVRAVIRGSAINNDGAAKVGYTAPSVEGQTAVLRDALRAAGVEPSSVGYVEGHGTATEMGDPIEVTALNQAYGGSAEAESIALGSVKSNLGHLDAAAGVAGLIKTALALEQGAIPPSLHFEKPNPKLDFAAGPFFVNHQLRPWPRGDEPRRAAVSSFGIGGTNAHAILEESPAREPREASEGPHLLVLSARDESALEEATVALAKTLDERPDLPLDSVAYTLQAGRRAFRHRRAVLATDAADAARALADPLRRWSRRSRSERPVVFLCSGQGSQYAAMGRDLYNAGGEFRHRLDRCAELMAPSLGEDLRALLLPPAGEEAEAGERLRQTALTQPALFAVEYALGCQWRAWGVEPQALVGHSVGQYAAACLAGVMSLEDAAELVVLRGRLIQELPKGAMLSVSLDAEEVAEKLGDELSLAAVNAPGLCVVSGPEAAVNALARDLAVHEVEHRRLHTSHAFHSSMMEPATERFRQAVEKVSLAAPELPLVSDLTGTWMSDEEATNPETWVAHLRNPVRFAAAVETLAEELDPVFLEVGPGKVLTTFARRSRPQAPAVNSLRHPQQEGDDHLLLLTALARLWLCGVPVDWRRFHAGEPPPKVSLPGYPFQRQRYWVEAAREPRPVAAEAPAVPADTLDPGSVAELPSPVAVETGGWSPAAVQSHPWPVGQRWLVFTDDDGLGELVSDKLQAAGVCPVRVWAASELRRLDDDAFTVDPRRREDFHQLLDLLADEPPRRVLMLWSAGGDPPEVLPGSARQAARELGPGAMEQLTAALAEKLPTQALTLEVVTTGGQRLEGDPRPEGNGAVQEERLAMARRCQRVPTRLPFAGCRHLDLEPRPSDELSVSAEEVLAELSSPGPGDGETVAVAYRGGTRWRYQRQVAKAAVPAEAETRKETAASLEAPGDSAAPSPSAEPSATPEPAAAEEPRGGPRPDLDNPFVAPETEDQQRVAAVWEEMLGIHPVGLHDDFFELGGHSLLGTRVLARLQDLYGVEIPLSALFQRPTVERLARLVEEDSGVTSGATLPEPMIPSADEESEDGMGVAAEDLSDDEVDALLLNMLSEGSEEAPE